MIPIYYFALGQLIYGAIERRSIRFTLFEGLGQAVFIGCSFITLKLIIDPIIRGASIGALFCLIPIGIRFLNRCPPIEADKQIAKNIPIGIINVSWIGMMAGALSCIEFAQVSSLFTDSFAVQGKTDNFYQINVTILDSLISHSITGFLALGAVLTACMSILWAGEIWRKRGKDDQKNYHGTTIAAIKMVFAFFWISFAVFAWIVWPLYARLVAITKVVS